MFNPDPNELILKNLRYKATYKTHGPIDHCAAENIKTNALWAMAIYF